MSENYRRNDKAAPVPISMAGWSLVFDPGGTLLGLSWQDGAPLLHGSDYEFDLGDGRIFHPRGWDECFPTIEAYGESGLMGCLIGHAPALSIATGRIVQQWTWPNVVARRTFSSPGANALRVGFEAENAGTTALEYLWASHALFSVLGLSKVTLPEGRVIGDFSLDATCCKFFVASGPVILEREESVVTLSTDQPFWGIWLNRGGWPAKARAGFACIGIEATNTDAEMPKGVVLQPDQIFQGHTILKVEPRASAPMA